MKLNGESRKEAISTKRITIVGTWNIRTMFEASKAEQISAERKAYHLDIRSLCETRWTGYRVHPLSSGDTVIYYGHLERMPHTLYE